MVEKFRFMALHKQLKKSDFFVVGRVKKFREKSEERG
jgi:hypothetical protein